MKNLFKAALVVACIFSTTSIFAQKMGRVNMQEVIMAMPETTQMQTNLEAFSKDLSDNLEAMQVEFNTKVQDYQKNIETMTASVRGLKEKDLQDLQSRMEQFQQSAQMEMQNKQNELLQPIIEKARGAVSTVAKQGAYVVIYDISAGASSLAYYDEAVVVDVTPTVKKALGIVAK